MHLPITWEGWKGKYLARGQGVPVLTLDFGSPNVQLFLVSKYTTPFRFFHDKVSYTDLGHRKWSSSYERLHGAGSCRLRISHRFVWMRRGIKLRKEEG